VSVPPPPSVRSVGQPARSAQLLQPAHLAVIGAAAGMGRWLSENVLQGLPWESVTLVDTAESITKLETGFACPVSLVHSAGLTSAALPLLRNTCVVVAVPLATLSEVAAWLQPSLTENSLVVDTSHDRRRSGSAWGTQPTVGLHALFGVTTPSAAGQTFAMCVADSDRAPAWLIEALTSAGGTVNVMSDARHDAVMAIVQQAAHQSLLTFADVVGQLVSQNGLDLETDLWANRTPVFELLTALAVRVLAPGQDATTASIQQLPGNDLVSSSLEAAGLRLAAARTGDDEIMNAYLASLREPFTGGLFAKISQAGALATSAVQASRTRVADHRRADELVGVRPVGNPDKLHVGRILATTPTSFTLQNLLVGSAGKAALMIDDAAIENARRQGIAGKTRTVEFRLGRVDVLSPAELDAALSHWLAVTTRGCKVFIPESISGTSAVRVVQSVPGVVDATLVTEEVRIGQRECVVKFSARLDADLAQLERNIVERVDDVFVWPDGVVLPLTRQALRLGFLGPAGTFSDVACRQLARLAKSGPEQERVEFADFDSLVAAIAIGTVDLAVLPITNSSSGLVDLAAGVLAASPANVTAGGVVDVPVRFDAYVAPGREFVEGGRVYSHPQAFRQCSQFVAAHRLEIVECTSTAEACRLVAERGDGVALAATGVNEDFGLVTARSSVGNLAGALTRFLVLGVEGMFAAPVRADALQRTVWIVEPEMAGRLPLSTRPRYDEVLRGPSGRTLLISTDPLRIPETSEGVRKVATIPWSPRTPLVVVD
jgi:prephenate dehydratase/prephenate dehydrogenase